MQDGTPLKLPVDSDRQQRLIVVFFRPGCFSCDETLRLLKVDLESNSAREHYRDVAQAILLVRIGDEFSNSNERYRMSGERVRYGFLSTNMARSVETPLVVQIENGSVLSVDRSFHPFVRRSYKLGR
jgi:hypothetical protein